MDATFRLKRSFRNQAAACSLAFAAWCIFTVCVSLADPRWAWLAFMASVPLLMLGLSLWSLAAYYRHELRIDGDRLVSLGVIRPAEIDLRDVREARWRTWPIGGSLALRGESGRLVINLPEYEAEDRARIIDLLRSALPLEVQAGWNLFAYKIADRLRLPEVRKPGPDEVLVRRGDCSRYFAPLSAAVCLISIATWWLTGDRGILGAPPFVLGLWAWVRWSTPSQGMIVSKVTGEDARFLRLLLGWTLVAFAGLGAHQAFWPRQEGLDLSLAVGIVVWLGVLLFGVGRADRRKSRRDQEAADLAAKGRGEAVVDPWRADGWEA